MKHVCVMRVLFNVIFRLHFIYIHSIQCLSVAHFKSLSVAYFMSLSVAHFVSLFMSRFCVARFVFRLHVYSRNLLAASEVQPCCLFYNVLVVVRGGAN